MLALSTNTIIQGPREDDEFNISQDHDIDLEVEKKSTSIAFLSRLFNEIPDVLVSPNFTEVYKSYQKSTTKIDFRDTYLENPNQIQNTSIQKSFLRKLLNEIYLSINSEKPVWYEEIEQSLCKISKLPNDWFEDSVSSFDGEIEEASKFFFAKFGALFPSKPFVYPTKKGDLSAELKIDGSSVTFIIMKSDLIVFVSSTDDTSYKIIQAWQSEPRRVVAEIEIAIASAQIS